MTTDVVTILPLPAFKDNYIWCIVRDGSACVVDPGDADPVMEALATHDLTLAEVWITHLHPDHTGGVARLKKACPTLVIRGPRTAAFADIMHGEADRFQMGAPAGLPVEVWEVPGHTPDHIAFLLQGPDGGLHVFCGDTLFSAGCGRLFGGTIQQLHDSLARFSRLPDETRFYPAHEYTLSNLRFARHAEPGNTAVASAIEAIRECPERFLPSLPTTLARERTINPFLRAISGTFQTSVSMFNRRNSIESFEIFGNLRKMKDSF
jgi:hydroxyacylglutathione hydrolase